MKGKTPKVLARDVLKLEAKIQKAMETIEGKESYLAYLQKRHTEELPVEISEARAELQTARDLESQTLAELTKPLSAYQYSGRYYGRGHEGPRRYSSEKAQAAWEAEQQAERAESRLTDLEAQAAQTLEEYTREAQEEVDSAWNDFQNLMALKDATVARIRMIMGTDTPDLAELAQDAPSAQADEEIPAPPLPPLPDDLKIPAGTLAVDARQLYEAARAVKQVNTSKLPVLSHALIRATDDGMKIITCTLADNEKGKKIKARSLHFWGNGARFETYVPAKTFTDWLQISAQSRDTLVMAFDPTVQVLQIRAGNARAEFKCLDAQEFPPC